MTRCTTFLSLACIGASAKAPEVEKWKMHHVHDWALEQNFSPASTSEVANRLRVNRVDGEILRKLERKDIEQYLGFDRSIAIKIHDAIHRLVGLADLTQEFRDQKDKKVSDANGKQCLVRCCCIEDESLPGERNRCVLDHRHITWTEIFFVGRGCGNIGDGWHAHTWWDNGRCLLPSSQAMQSGTCDGKSAVALTSATVLLNVLAIIVGVGSCWSCWKLAQAIMAWQCVLSLRQFAKNKLVISQEFLDRNLDLLVDSTVEFCKQFCSDDF
jgi:hypothetical protein